MPGGKDSGLALNHDLLRRIDPMILTTGRRGPAIKVVSIEMILLQLL